MQIVKSRKIQRTRRQPARNSGSSLAEVAGIMVVVIPLLILMLFVGIEASRYVAILQGLEQGARHAARNLATAYATDHGIVNDATAQTKYGFSNALVPGIVTDAAQYDVPVWDNVPGANNEVVDATIPASVTVWVTYKSAGTHTVPQFPDIDPLNLGPNLQLRQSATYTIEGG